ncbi:aromatic acid exporter family protein [Bacillus sp. AGMB 02131]|uniref:Aromatic acid exporter family protein n=1 Tax=Peribacillus faecalis TaxID=2772559 RepID=A0A927HAI7_9BACI|nr:aromatic acid exporter family protein [Peribacillus faecalis]MBD3108725.1 aromatic acid exporter family protein [Peribacillus faecalis]
MKIGARILKTGIAIILALTLAQMLKLPSPAFAGIAAIFAIQPTIFRSYRTIIEQVQGNVIGAIVAILFVLAFGNHAFLVGLACIIIIIINVRLKSENTISLSVVTVIAIMESQTGHFLEFALLRFFSIMLGIFSAFIVNLFFLPPKYETKLYTTITEVTEDIYRWIRISTRNLSEHTHLKGEIQNLKERILRLEQFYLMYKEDRELFKKDKRAKARKLVVYRQMIATTRRLFDILRKMNKYENQIHHMPEEFRTTIRDQLDYLIVQHEQIHLKYARRIRTSVTFEKEQNKTNKELFDLVLSLQHKTDEDTEAYIYHMMGLVSTIIDYEEMIEHLDKLINSFQSFHKDDDEIKVVTMVEN